MKIVYSRLLELAANGTPRRCSAQSWNEDLYLARFPAAEVVVSFLAVMQDRYILVKGFEDA